MRHLKIYKSITNVEDKSLKSYLREINREEILSVEDEYKLSKKIKKGDYQALDKLVRANLRFVVSVAKQYQNHGLLLSDLIQEGNLGLIQAAEKFDEERGYKFISYAVWWIRNSIIKSLSQYSGNLRNSLNFIEFNNKIKNAFRCFEQMNERCPSAEEIAEEIDYPIDKVSNVIYKSNIEMPLNAPFANEGINYMPNIQINGGEIFTTHLSIDTSLVDGEADSLLDILIDEDSISPEKGCLVLSQKIEINRILIVLLNEREYQIIKLSFGLDCDEMTLEKIGDKFGLTRERVRQIKERALRKIREYHNPIKKILWTGCDYVRSIPNGSNEHITPFIPKSDDEIIVQEYEDGIISFHNAEKSLIALANKGDIECQYKLAQGYKKYNYDMQLEMKWLTIAAYNGNANAQYDFGYRYEHSINVDDIHYAIKWYQKAADQGHEEAKERISIVQNKIRILREPKQDEANLKHTEITKKNVTESKTLPRYTAKKKAETKPKNVIESKTSLKYTSNSSIDDLVRGVANGDANAQYVLGWNYCFGMYVKKNPEIALELFEKAAAQGHGKAQFNIGQMYDYGHGVERNINKAIFWYKLAADKGIDAAISRLRVLKEKGILK